MYKRPIFKNSAIHINQGMEGESIERKFERMLENKEGITDGAPIIFTERKDGVQAGYNIRTDRFEIALDGMDTINKSLQAKREEKANMKVVKEAEISETENIQGTDN